VFRGTDNTPTCRASVENCPRPLEHQLEIQIKYTGRAEEEPHYQAIPIPIPLKERISNILHE